MIRVCPSSALPRGEAPRVDVEPPVPVFHTEDGEVSAADDTCTHDVFATHPRGDVPVGVPGMTQTRPLGRRRRRLDAAVMV